MSAEGTKLTGNSTEKNFMKTRSQKPEIPFHTDGD